jgi:hypothetical protein
MTIKNDMKENTTKANNLLLGAVYINATTGQPCRLVNIVSCQGVWLESYDGQGYGELVKFEDCHYASQDDVDDYLEDLRVYTASEKAPTYKPDITNWSKQFLGNKELIKDSDGSMVVGWYDDNDGNDIRCRD